MSDNGTDKDNDIDLFRREVAGVKPLGQAKVHRTTSGPAPEPVQSRKQAAQLRDEMLNGAMDHAELETGEDLLFQRAGVQRSVLRRLRRGQLSVQAELDLHGLRVPAAQQAVAEFLKSATRSAYRCVRIIHGKGLGSIGREPVLKRKLGAWLRRRNEVLAYCSARPADGGTGAVYVLLQTQRS